jgi:hypothetical protein
MYKYIMHMALCISAMVFFTCCYAQDIAIKINGTDAKNIFIHLTGKDVIEQGAAGHIYKEAKNIICQRINADMTDEKGNDVPHSDVRRYSCTLIIDENGVQTGEHS